MCCKSRSLFHLILIATVLFGCAVVDYLPGSPSAAAKAYISQGRASENAGDWVAAARNYRLALKVEPQNKQATESLKRVEAKRLKLAEAHYRKGLAYLRQGKYSDGQRQFW